VTRRRPTLVPVLAALVGLLAGLLTAAVAAPASAAPVTDFEAGYIISDAIMYDTGTMSADAIAQFLASKGASCTPSPSTNTCLKNYRESTPTRPADSLCPVAYTGSTDETSARIISKAATACGINPQVLLVTLQKEQSLVTSTTGKAAATYARALGFGCPDTGNGWCDPQYAGFANQVYSAAKQLKRYAANPTSYSYRAGRTNTILYNPNTACGSSSVYIENQATASLYNYTPYQPNAAALAAGYGSGDSCSAYGNRNFHLYFTSWFGSAKQRTSLGVIDTVRDAGSGTVQVTGWAFDPDVSTGITLHAYVDGVATLAFKASGARPDVQALYGHGAISGYDARFSTSTGTHSVCLYAIDGNGGTNVLLGCRDVTVVNHTSIGVIDVARDAGSNRIEVGGWAFDPDVSTAIGVHVYVDGVATLAMTASGKRPDVYALYGGGAVSGYGATFPAAAGTHSVCLYAIDGNGGTNVLLGCRTVSVSNRTPLGVIDVARDAGAGQIQVAGWAFDPDVKTAINVHVYVDGVATAATLASGERPDVYAIYHGGAVSGYDTKVPASAGKHSVCLYAIDASGGINVLLGCRDVTVAASNRTPVGVIDQVRDIGGGQVVVGGWAFDPDVATGITVKVAVDGGKAVSITADGARPDVAAAYGAGAISGYGTTLTVAAGTHEVCVTAVDANATKVSVSLGCRTVPVA